MRVFRFVLAFRTLIASIADTFLVLTLRGGQELMSSDLEYGAHVDMFERWLPL